MPRFFISTDRLPAGKPLTAGDVVTLDEADSRHVSGSLRMQAGDRLTLCDGRGTEGEGEIVSVEGAVTVRVLSAAPTAAEPSLHVTLYQGLPKSDKMEFIVQKAVELGVGTVVPVETPRSIARLGDKAAAKQKRWQKIADEAAGQCGRGVLPTVAMPLTWKQALDRLRGENAVVLYEGGGDPLGALVARDCTEIAVVVGPEGGFAAEEIAALRQAGVRCATLGKRILRCETAPLAVLAILMHLTGNME